MSIFNNLGIRFRDHYTHPEKPDIVLDRFKTMEKEASLEIQIAYHSVFIKIPDEFHRWWSPELTVNIEAHENGSVIKEVTGPNPGTVTLAMFFFIGAITFFFFALMFAFSQIQLDKSPLISLIVIAGSTMVAILVFIILGMGRRKAQPQIEKMKEYVKEVL